MPDTWRRDSWLESFLGKPSWHLEYNSAWNSNKESLCGTLSESIRQEKGLCFADIKIPTKDTQSIQEFENWGFHLVDTNIVFEKEIDIGEELINEVCALAWVSEEDKRDVMKIASNTFVFTRFHMDTEIKNDIANKIKAEWAGNYFSGKRGDKMLLAKVDKQVAGFLQLLKGENNTWVIDLIGISIEHQRKKIASNLILSAEKKLKDCRRMLVGTQVANIASLRLYEKLGYRIIDTKYVLHYHGKNQK
jgi:ribosomal protein S18 acetylase RimI-like enzyme